MRENTEIYQRQTQPAKLLIYENGAVREQLLRGAAAFGRATQKSTPDIASHSTIVSRAHGEFLPQNDAYYYRDLGSANGTLLNGEPLSPNAPQKLTNGDVLRVHLQEDPGCARDVLLIYTTEYHEDLRWNTLPLDDSIAAVAVGRAQELALHDAGVSRRHGSFFRSSRGWAVIDHGSLNGIFLNNRLLNEPRLLSPMDVVRITDHQFIFTPAALVYQEDAAPASQTPFTPAQTVPQPVQAPPYPVQTPPVPAQTPPQPVQAPPYPVQTPPIPVQTPPYPVQAPPFPVQAVPQPPVPPPYPVGAESAKTLSVWIEERNVWHRAKKKTLLKDIRLELSAGEMVLVLGGSGAGKTTFMNAVMGYEKAEGQILYDGADIYEEYEKMKYEIGYVPQQDLLRLNDTVYDTLFNAARMRLPSGLSRAEYETHVEETIGILGLDRVRDSLVGKLSGGQRKRLSIAVEFVGNPSLFFLDEPDSGLDGTMARALMENLRAIADHGKIVIVISHSPDRAFELFDKVIVLAKGAKDDVGHLVFFGSPQQACAFFETETLERIVRRINNTDEGGDGLADHFIAKFEEMSNNG